MAWNEPGGGRNQDPWGGRGDQGPPDLDEVLRRLQRRLGGLFGGRGGHSGGGRGPGAQASGMGAGIIVVVLALFWFFSGIYIIDQGKRGVVLRFGRFTEVTMPGPHWHIPYPVERVYKVDVGQQRFVEIGYRSAHGRTSGAVAVPKEALMLTADENIVAVQIAVQYQVKDPQAYLFNVRDPAATLKQVTESALREVIGKSKMDFVLTEGRSEIVARTRALVQKILDQYHTGLYVTSVNLQDAQPPEQVQAAFHDAIKAREDEARLKNEAEAYANDVIPRARGAAARKRAEANGYKEAVIARAQGDAARFEQLLAEYRKAPEVTRKRLYLETMEAILSDTSKVMLDLKQGSNLVYLPLDRLLGQPAAKAPKEPFVQNPPSRSNSRPAGRARRSERNRPIRESR